MDKGEPRKLFEQESSRVRSWHQEDDSSSLCWDGEEDLPNSVTAWLCLVFVEDESSRFGRSF